MYSPKVQWLEFYDPNFKMIVRFPKCLKLFRNFIISSGLRLLNDFREFDYRNFLSFSFSIYRNRISFPILCCATVQTYRDRPFTALTYRRIQSPPIRSVIIISSNLTLRVKQADRSHWQIVRTKWGRRRRDREDANQQSKKIEFLLPRIEYQKKKRF